MKYIKRIFGLPFFLLLNIVGIVFHLFLISKYWIMYGGEAMAYDNKNKPKMIADVYDMIEKRYCFNCEIDMPVKERRGCKSCSNCGLSH